ncbi:hypothetical protein [Candidatus Tisiphia endosymbiont of Myopa tessellatipennis]|uniref:hypothetical protein n=1 Tax=Candidatus Tisiphia endosymbiont of Myopa tessellatipennis TaxID=3066257 RepID=UPI00313AF982
MSKSFVEKVKKGAAKLADKVEQKVEQFVDAVPTDDEIMDKLRDGFKKINSKVAQVSPESAKTLRKIEGKIGVKPSPQNLAEIVDDLHNLKDNFMKDMKTPKVITQFGDFLKSTIALIGSIGKSAKERGKAYNNFTKSVEALGKAISKAFEGPSKTR